MSTIDNQGYIHDTDEIIIDKSGQVIMIVGSVGLLSVILVGLGLATVLRGRTLANAIAVPISVIGAGLGLTGIGRIMQSSKKMRDIADASGRILMGVSLMSMPITFILVNEPLNHQNLFGIESSIGIIGAITLSIAEDRANIIKWNYRDEKFMN